MRVVVVGATGNTGTAVLRRLARSPEVDAMSGVARRVPDRRPGEPYEGVDWHPVDVGAGSAVAELTDVFAGAAAVIHLAWQIQPSHQRHAIRRTNVTGTAHVVEAVARAAVPALVVASSVGAYAPGPKDEPVGEDWPVTGVAGSTYSRDKADVEALLDDIELAHPGLRIVRMRPGLIFQGPAAAEIGRFFVGPLAPLPLLRAGWIPLVPAHPRLRVQALHADDAAEAYVRAALGDARGPFNLAADPVLDGARVAARFAGRTVPVPPGVLRIAASLTWHARLQPTEPGWIPLAAQVPLMSTGRAEKELGWRPRVDALDALAELVDGLARGTGAPAPPLRPRGLPDVRVPGYGNPY